MVYGVKIGGMTSWSSSDIPDQSGRVFVVTGANSGLGLVASRELAAKGAFVVMACRDVEKGQRVRAEVMPGGDERSQVRHLDLADLESVHRFADEWGDRPISVVINNAGVMNTPLRRTAQGHELQFGTNVLGHFALMQRLWDLVTDRTVWLGSIAHRMGRPDLTDVDWRSRRYSSWQAYADSKMACVLLAYEQQRRLLQVGDSRRAMAAHPGIASTDLFRSHVGKRDANWLMGAVLSTLRCSQSPEEGALPELFAATVPHLAGGSYVGPGGFAGVVGAPRVERSIRRSYDVAAGRQLWQVCESLTAR